MARRIGAAWFSAAVTFDEFVNAPHGYYSVDGAEAVDLGEITCEAYQSEPDELTGQTVTMYRGTYNPTIPAGALGDNVVLTIADPVGNDVLAYDAIDVCTDEATSVVVSPSTTSVSIGKTRQFSAAFYAADLLSTTNHDTVVWSTTASGATQGSINSSTGLFTAGSAAGGPYTVTATAGAIHDDAAGVSVVEVSGTKPPTIGRRIGIGVGI